MTGPAWGAVALTIDTAGDVDGTVTAVSNGREAASLTPDDSSKEFGGEDRTGRTLEEYLLEIRVGEGLQHGFLYGVHG